MNDIAAAIRALQRPDGSGAGDGGRMTNCPDLMAMAETPGKGKR